jgi:hypothetical protein
MTESFVLGAKVEGGVMFRGVVAATASDGRVVVTRQGTQPPETWQCELLEKTDGCRLTLAPGDAVLVCGDADHNSGVVLGRIGVAGSGADEVVVEAGKTLVLRCGDGSITLRADGKILIKGKDLVSHAQRTNRIKGGSVAIN